jgi:ADP-heptose:LPS heptosyltransferase
VKVKLPKERISRFQRNLALLKGVGLDVKEFAYRLHIPSEAQVHLDSFFKASGAFLRRPLIAIHPGTSTKTSFKRWMPDQYAKLADRLVRELKAEVLFTWGADELSWVEGIRKTMKESSVLGPQTESLTQLGEVYRNCDLYISGDTGPMHIASLIGIPVVVIYGPTDPIVNEPFGRHKKVRKEVGCNPCRNRSCKKLTCLELVTIDDVFNAVREILSVTHCIPTDRESNPLNPPSSPLNLRGDRGGL